MEEQKKSNLLFLSVTVMLGVIVIGGVAYYFMHQSSAPQTPVYQPTTTNVPQQPTLVNTPVASATLNQNSLTSNSSTPTITGSFANTTGLEVLITKSNLPSRTLLSNSIANVVWDDRSDHGGGVVLNGSPSGTFSSSVTAPLPDGTYSVGVYIVTIYYPQTDANLARDYRQLLTSGTLTVHNKP